MDTNEINLLTEQATGAYLGRSKDCCDLEPEIKAAIYTLIPILTDKCEKSGFSKEQIDLS